MADAVAEFQRTYNKGSMLLEELLLSFGEKQDNHFLQALPIRVSVWRAFSVDTTRPVNLLLTPSYKVPTETAMARLRRTLRRREMDMPKSGLIALTNSIHINASLRDFLFAILPHTYWWHNSALPGRDAFDKAVGLVTSRRSLRELGDEFDASRDKAIWRFFAAWAVIDLGQAAYDATVSEDQNASESRATTHANTARWQTILEFCDVLLRLGDDDPDTRISDEETARLWDEFFPQVVRNNGELVAKITDLGDAFDYDDARHAPIWSVDQNRPVSVAVATSRKTIKADAAREVFGDQSQKIRWAVIDSGIDATHPAFQDRDNAQLETIDASGRAERPRPSAADSRILATYDFNRLLSLFGGKYEELLPKEVLADLQEAVTSEANSGPESLDVAILMYLYKCNATGARQDLSTMDLREALHDDDFAEEVQEYVEDIKRLVTEGRTIDWPLVEPLLRVPHNEVSYGAPENVHGTHVAGILAGDLKKGELTADPVDDGDPLPQEDVRGVCPSIKLYDLRVCDDQGQGEEFLVLAALQFIGYLNRDRAQRLVHGANISLSLKHEVRNYACGQTPVCREANRLVGDGVVVVAAAGNCGFQRLNTENGLIDAYNAISITDPGNAESVITVGSTYREQPHSYGVSYFSSRGPTGDGRQKPDLVAPGEKIWAPMPKRRIGDLHGTSMAAPHVSGAAALLMARHTELIGDPRRVKEVLCASATDLGRKTEFQGHGLVDVLRALQSV